MRHGIDGAEYRSELVFRQIVVSRQEIVPRSRIIPDLVGATDSNDADDSTIEAEVVAGEVDDEGPGRLLQIRVRGCRLKRECCVATEQRLVAWSECETGGRAVRHQEGIGDLVRLRINDGNPALRRVFPDLRNRDVEQACLRRPLWLFDPILSVDRGMYALVGRRIRCGAFVGGVVAKYELGHDRLGFGIEHRDEGWSIGIVCRGKEVVARVISHLVNPGLSLPYRSSSRTALWRYQ